MLQTSKICQTVIATFLLGMSGPVFAQSATPEKPAAASSETVNVEAAEMEILDAEKKTIFRGDVVAKRAKETIRCPEMVIIYVDVKQPDGTMKSEADLMDCQGSTIITTPSQKITGDKAKLFLRKDELVVTGNVKVTEGKTVLRGTEFFSNTKTKRSVMKGGGGGRVKGSFVP
jgi:lipopolysaccharide export system protein LptA